MIKIEGMGFKVGSFIGHWAGFINNWGRIPVARVAVEAQLPVESPVDVPEEALANATTHLEFMGYSVRPWPGGNWLLAEHAYHNNFFISEFAGGFNLYCYMSVGTPLGSARGVWMDFVNDANMRAKLVRSCLELNADGLPQVTLRAHVTGAYERRAFGLSMEIWHEDNRFLQQRSAMVANENSVSDDTDIAVAVTVVH